MGRCRLLQVGTHRLCTTFISPTHPLIYEPLCTSKWRSLLLFCIAGLTQRQSNGGFSGAVMCFMASPWHMHADSMSCARFIPSSSLLRWLTRI